MDINGFVVWGTVFYFISLLSPVSSGNCDNIVTLTTSWPGGWQANLNIPITNTISSWTADITFSSAITSLDIWNALSSSTDLTTFHLTNAAWNGQQNAGTIFNSIGFNVYYPTTYTSLTVTKILFNGVNICSGTASPSPTTVAPTTISTTRITATSNTATATAAATTITTTKTPISVTTAASNTASSCNSLLVVTNSWDGGWQANLNILIPQNVNSWSVDLTFSSDLSSLEVWTAQPSILSSVKYRLTNMSWNNVQNAGTTLTINFLVRFAFPGPIPNLIAVTFNGVNICAGTLSTTMSTFAAMTTSSTTPAATTTTTTKSSVTTSAAATSTSNPVTGTPLVTKYNYSDVISKSLLFYAAQRSGRLPLNNPIPYRGDSALNDAGSNGEDLTGGYYDAGDHVKFGFPMAAMTTVIAWSVIDYADGYSTVGQLSQVQNMIQWSTDYFLKAHVSTNKFYGQVGDGNIDHSYWGRPEDMTMARPAFYIDPSLPGSDLAGETAAALAAASIVFSTVNSTYASLLLTHAQQLYNFANQYRGNYDSSITNAANFYKSWSGYGDELAWAATWLYRATGNSNYLTDATNHYTNFGLSKLADSFSWDDKTAGVQVLLAQLTGQSQYRTAIQSFCDSNLYTKTKTPKGLVFISQWGSLRYAANSAFICLKAADLTISSLAYRQFAQKQIHYALGDTGRSYVVGFGTNPPVKPHHRSSSCKNRPSTCDWNDYNSPNANPQTLWGALVGGPDANDNYTDDRSNYQMNEVACDYNAGFQSAVAALQSLATRRIFN